MKSILSFYRLSKQPVLLRLRSDLQPPPGMMGPGLIEELPPEMREAMLQDGHPDPDGFLVFQMPVQQNDRAGTLPMIVRADDVLWVSPGVKLAEEPRIVSPGPLSFGGRA